MDRTALWHTWRKETAWPSLPLFSCSAGIPGAQTSGCPSGDSWYPFACACLWDRCDFESPTSWTPRRSNDKLHGQGCPSFGESN